MYKVDTPVLGNVNVHSTSVEWAVRKGGGTLAAMQGSTDYLLGSYLSDYPNQFQWVHYVWSLLDNMYIFVSYQLYIFC